MESVWGGRFRDKWHYRIGFRGRHIIEVHSNPEFVCDMCQTQLSVTACGKKTCMRSVPITEKKGAQKLAVYMFPKYNLLTGSTPGRASTFPNFASSTLAYKIRGRHIIELHSQSRFCM